MGIENGMGGGVIDWAAYREQKRESLKDLSIEELRSRLAARQAEIESYDGQYGAGNSFSAGAMEDVSVLKQLIQDRQPSQE